MKIKLLLGIFLGTIAQTNVFAQNKPLIEMGREMQNIALPQGIYKPKSAMSQKHTRGGARWYSQVEAVSLANGSDLTDASHTNINPLWEDSTITARYNTGQAPVWIKSIAQVLDPRAQIFNDPSVYPGEIAIGNNSSFSIDSVAIGFLYRRNPSKMAIVDTLLVSVSKGNTTPSDLRFWYDKQGFIQSNYNVDSIEVADPRFDFVTQTLKKDIGSLAYTLKIPLNFEPADTVFGGSYRTVSFPVVGLQNLPAKSIPVLTMNFISGDTWTPYVDSVSQLDAGKNYMLFLSSKENPPAGFRYYAKGDYNVSSIMRNDTSGWGEYYIPSYFFYSPSYEFHWIDWKLSCPTCWTVGTKEVSLFNHINISPNPASNQISITVNLSEDAKNVTVEISNTLGQIVKKVDFGNTRANQTSGNIINISDLTQGIYIYTIRANGQSISNKLLVE